jgi:hypothetical protein
LSGFPKIVAGPLLSRLPLLLLIRYELAVHFFNLRSQIFREQLNFNARFAQESISKSANVGIRIKHPDNNAGNFSVGEPLGAANFRWVSFDTGFERRVNSSSS